jgi:hypothetical protein
MYSVMDTWFISQVGFPIRKSMGLSLLSANHGLSQIATSFVGS